MSVLSCPSRNLSPVVLEWTSTITRPGRRPLHRLGYHKLQSLHLSLSLSHKLKHGTVLVVLVFFSILPYLCICLFIPSGGAVVDSVCVGRSSLSSTLDFTSSILTSLSFESPPLSSSLHFFHFHSFSPVHLLVFTPAPSYFLILFLSPILFCPFPLPHSCPTFLLALT